MELLVDVCHMESRFGLFRNCVSFGARYVHGLRLMHHSVRPCLVPKKIQDSPSHRILRHMHRVLNFDENKN